MDARRRERRLLVFPRTRSAGTRLRQRYRSAASPPTYPAVHPTDPRPVLLHR